MKRKFRRNSTIEPRFEVVWNNPPDGTATISAAIRGGVYERRIRPMSLLTPIEVSIILELSLVRTCELIEAGRLRVVWKEKVPHVKMKDVMKFKEQKRPSGRSMKIPYLGG